MGTRLEDKLRERDSASDSVAPGSTIDDVLNLLADRIAERVRAQLLEDGTGTSIRPRLITVDQAATYLGRTKDAVQHLISSGKLPTVRSDRRVFIDVRDLDTWIEDNKQRGIV